MKKIFYSETSEGYILIDKNKTIEDAVREFADNESMTAKEIADYIAERRKKFVFYETKKEMSEDEIGRI